MATRSSKQCLSYDSDGDSQPGESVSQAHVCALRELQHRHTSQSARDEALKLGIVPSDTICRPCRDDLRRICNNPNHVPRWEKKRQAIIKCSINGCDDACFTKLQVCNIKERLEKIPVEVQFAENVPFPTPLCNSHYYFVYNAIHQPRQRNCQTYR